MNARIPEAKTVCCAAPLVRFSGVTLRLHGVDVFEDTEWAIQAGEQWAVLGGNGSGKSTLLRAILGDVPVSRGEIEYGLDGVPGAPPRAWFPENAIAYVSLEQHRAVMGAAMAFYQARWSPVDDDEPVLVRDFLRGADEKATLRRVRDALALFDLAPLSARRITTLSNGEMRKVLLAQALLTRPRLLILDDPFSGMDTESRGRLRRMLHCLMAKGQHVVLATTRPEEIPAGVSHVLAVDKQRVLLQGHRDAMLADRRTSALSRAPRRIPVPELRFYSTRHQRTAPASPPPLVEMRGVQVRYGRTEILRRVTWTVHAGERWVLRSPNGSGKSTLISLILADNPQAYANDIRLFGIQRGTGESIWEVKRHIGWMGPELQFLYPGDAACFDVVCSGLYDTVGLYRDCSRRETRAVRCWMGNVGLAHLAGVPFGAVSDSQQRLILLARAMVKEPPLVVLDEPCQGLDSAHRALVLGIIERIARASNAAMIHVTHHADEIPKVFTHELRLNAGRVTKRGQR